MIGANPERTHRYNCPAWLAWDEPFACKCDRPILRAPVPQCAGCGRYVAAHDPATKWESERGEFGVVLSTWVKECRYCRPEEPTDVWGGE